MNTHSDSLPPHPHLRRISREKMEVFLKDCGEPSYRLKQIRDWLWVKGETSLEKMSNLNQSLIKKLRKNFFLKELSRDHEEVSDDGTIKIRLRTEEGYFLESVFIPSGNRNTLCVSSQIGCSLNCRFCATAQMERKRNLFFDEIFDQFRWGYNTAISRTGRPLTNLVFMGMGEPLLNYEEVLRAISLITDPQGFDFKDDGTPKYFLNKQVSGFSPRRITLSTAGIVAGIRRLGDDRVPFELALSLHAATDNKRGQIMMSNPRNNIDELKSALHYFYKKAGSKITLEYLLLSGFNDKKEDAYNLIRFYHQVPASLVNLIEFNPVLGVAFTKPQPKIFSDFVSILKSQGVNVRVRCSRGKDIAAACGQLANQKN